MIEFVTVFSSVNLYIAILIQQVYMFLTKPFIELGNYFAIDYTINWLS